MAKSRLDRITLDTEVENLVRRIGELPKPRNYILNYTINRDGDKLTTVAVTFITDSEFCKEEEGVQNA